MLLRHCSILVALAGLDSRVEAALIKLLSTLDSRVERA